MELETLAVRKDREVIEVQKLRLVQCEELDINGVSVLQ